MASSNTATDGRHKTLQQSERKYLELQARILAIPGSQHVLRRLTRAGADQGRILSLLASAVGDNNWWLDGARRTKKGLESFANQLETVANHAQRISLDHFSYVSLWLAMLGIGKWERVKSPKEGSPTWLFELMRLYAKNRRDLAKALGKLLTEHPPKQRRAMIDCLLLEVWMRSGRYHDKEIAFLLTNAFEAVGRKREFTEIQIQKHRQRYVVPGIRRYLEREAGSLKFISGKDRLLRALRGSDFISSV